jgi:DNA-binding CsgD family transcriptional regulator/tetratricopeptide (TPR) repeat protein
MGALDGSAVVKPGELLERAAELAALSGALASVREDGRGRIVRVAGEAGSGKTSLLRRFRDEVADAVPVLMGGCDPLFTPRPLGGLLAVAEDVGGELEQTVAHDAAPHEVVGALARALRVHDGAVLVIEDVHWADEATLDVLRLVARRIERIPALVVVTYRDDELERSHPLRLVLGELASGEPTRRLTLQPLSVEAIARLAEPRGVDAEELHRTTGGNPFFVVEALAGDGDAIPATVVDAVLGRAARLGPHAHAVLEAVAIAPPSVELWLLGALAGDDVDALDECLGSGMLTATPSGVSFRHELARLAIEGSISPARSLELHRLALELLARPQHGEPDLARLAHHAECAGDVAAVIRYAPAAAERAASFRAHREAVDHYGRALRGGGALAPAERARLLGQQALSCFPTDQYTIGIAALEEEVALRRQIGDRSGEGSALSRLSTFLWCPGRTAESRARAHEAVAVLEVLPPGAELAHAYLVLANKYAWASRNDEAIDWATRARELAVQVGAERVAARAASVIGSSLADYGLLEETLAWFLAANLDDAGETYDRLAGLAVAERNRAAADRYLAAGLAFVDERALELTRLYLLSTRARFELDQGRWAEAAETATTVLRIPRTSTTPRIHALTVLALVRARRGDPDVVPLLDEAWALAEPTGEIDRLGPVAVARAEVAWLGGATGAIAEISGAPLALALQCNHRTLGGELAVWRLRAGIEDGAPPNAVAPRALELAGEWRRAAAAWQKAGCPYEAALALAESEDEEDLTLAGGELLALDAAPAAAIVSRRLRDLGFAERRGPRRATRANPGGLTPRQLEVLVLVAGGHSNREIAERLVLSERTVGHHVGAVLRKLNAKSRAEASAHAVRLGVVSST